MPVGHREVDPADILGTAENAAYYSQGRHPGVAAALAWLAFSHLPEELKTYSRPFYQSGIELVMAITTDSPELTTALNKLVEAKDWAVRAGVRRSTGRPGPMARPGTIVDPPVLPVIPERSGPIRPDQIVPGMIGRPIRDNPQA